MLTNGINHVAVLTSDTDRLVAFYRDVFEAEVVNEQGDGEHLRLTLLRIGEFADLNIFQIDGNDEAARQTPMFARGRLDHVGYQAASLEAFEEIRRRLIARGATDDFVTDFGPALSMFFRDPDGLECEVLVENPDALPGVFNPPGTPALRYVQQPS